MSAIAIQIALDVAWDWFQRKAPDVIKKVVDEVLEHIYRIVSKVDEALEILWRDFAEPTLQTIFPILGRILGFPVDVLEFILGKAYDLLVYLYGLIDILIHEVEFKIYDIVVSAVRSVYDFVTSMFVNVYNAVRSVYVGVRDVTTGFILSTVRRIRERLHTIITVDLWILGCWKAFQGSLESFSFGDFLKSAVLCLMAPVASGYIAGIITSLTPTPGTEFPGFVPSLEFPELRVEDLPGFSVVTPPPVSFPAIGVSTLPFALGMDLNVGYGVVGAFVLSDSVSVVLRDVWVVPGVFVFSDSVSMGLSDVWSYVLGGMFGLSDGAGLGLVDSWSYSVIGRSLDLSDSGVGLSLSDGWGYGLAMMLGLDDSVGLSLFDSWGYVAYFEFTLGDSVGLGLSDSWIVWMDEIGLVSFAGFSVGYPAVMDVSDVIVSIVSVGYPAMVDVVDVTVPSVGVGYPAMVDVVDLVIGVSVG